MNDHSLTAGLRSSIGLKIALSDIQNCKVTDKEEYLPIKNSSPDAGYLYSPLASPGFIALAKNLCEKGRLVLSKYVDWNRACTILAALFMVFSVRFLTSSWVLGAAVGAALISRGSMLARHGDVGPDAIIMLVVTGWFAFFSHFLKTAATMSLFGMLIFGVIGVVLEKSLLVLVASIPMGCIAIFMFRGLLLDKFMKSKNSAKRVPLKTSNTSYVSHIIMRGEKIWRKSFSELSKRVSNTLPISASISFKRGGSFETLNIPFSLWLLKKRRWIKMVGGWGVVLVLLGALVLYLDYLVFQISSSASYFTFKNDVANKFIFLKGDALETWLGGQMLSVDLYFSLSVFVLGVYALMSPHPRMNALKETISFLIISVLAVGLFSFFLDSWDYTVFHYLSERNDLEVSAYAMPIRPFLYWFEPVVTGIGISGLYSFIMLMVRK